MICPKCGKENDNDALYCGGCGSSLIGIKTSSDIAKEVANVEEKKDEIELVINTNTDLEMSKIEDELNREEDLGPILSSTTTAAVDAGGNAQAQTVVHQAVPELDEKTPSLELPPTKTEELIAQKQKEKELRDARLEERRKELERELNANKKQEQPKVAHDQIYTQNDKIWAVLSYFMPLTWIISYFVSGNQKSEYLKEKLNESLVLNILHILRILPIVGGLANIAAFVLKIIAIVNTLTDKNEKLPVISDIKIIK